jgi:hypothetical protein
MMAGKKQCSCCGKMFVPDRRCRGAPEDVLGGVPEGPEEREQQALRRRNPDYWLGRYDAVRSWREEHPDYQRDRRQRRKKQRMTLSAGEIQSRCSPNLPYGRCSSRFVFPENMP